MTKLRTTALLGAVAAMMAAGCSGGGSSSAKSTTTRAHRTSTTTTKATSATTTTGSSGPRIGAKVRVVNLAVQNGAGVQIDVYGGLSAVGKPLATVDFGTASPYLDPPKSGPDSTLSFYLHGKTDTASKLIDQSGKLGSGDQETYFVWYGAHGGTGTAVGHVQTVVEAAPAGSPAATNVSKVPDQKALIQVFASQTGTLASDLTFDLGLPVGGCLPQLSADGTTGGGSGTRALIGGTAIVDYVTDPGAQQVGLFAASASNCAAPPTAGPTDITPSVGQSTLLVVYGTSPQAIKLLPLPTGG